MADSLVAKIDLDKVGSYKAVDFIPVLMTFDKWLFRLNAWEEFVKIFYYLLYKTEEGKFAIEQNVGKCRIDNSSVYILTNDNYHDTQKFSPSFFARVDKVVPYRNVLLPLEIREVAKIHGFMLFVRRPTTSIEQIEPMISRYIESVTRKGSERRYVIKSTKHFIAHINGECLSEAEKFYLRIEKEFDKKILLGDIVTTEREDILLSQYMQVALRGFLLSNSTRYRPSHEKVFAYGLVRFAMKHYSQRTFWPFFKQEFGLEIGPNKQGELHDLFRSIMLGEGKTYDDTLKQKIDNINLHSFVVDKCADQLFDYLFDYWRIDLKRNLDNIKGDDGKDNFNALISELMSNNERSVPDVMKHTSMALALNEKSCRLRIRRMLALMDDCFWRHSTSTIPSTGNRINELLRAWMDQPNGKFQNEYKLVTRNHGVRGESLLLRPQLSINMSKIQY